MALDTLKLAQIVSATERVEREMRAILTSLNEVVDSCTLVSELAESFVVVKDAAENLHEVVKDINKLKDFISYTKLPEAFGEEEIKTLTTESGYRVTIVARTSVSFVPSLVDLDWLKSQPWASDFVTRISNTPDEAITAKMAGYEWLRKSEMGALIQETVNASSLSAAMKEKIEEDGRDPPIELFSVKISPYASVTKTKPSKK